MMFLDPSGFDHSTTPSALSAASFSARSALVFLMFIPRLAAWAASMAASGLKMKMATSSASMAPTLAHPNDDSSKYYFHFDSWRMNVQPGIWLPVAIYVEETERMEGNK